MGELAARTIFSNDTGPQAGVGLDTLAKNQAAILELEGAQAPQSKSILDGALAPTASYVIVDTEGGASADDLVSINPVLSVTENLHTGMIVHLRAADSGHVVTIKNTTGANGINTYDGKDYVLSPTHWLKLQLRADLKWYEVEGRAMEKAIAATTAAATAQSTADTAKSTASAAYTQFATSSTASGTAAKTAALSGFSLHTGARVIVTFSNANTVSDALTLNVNSTGDISIYNQYGGVSSANPAMFPAGQHVEFIYDSSGHWLYIDRAREASTAASPSARYAVLSLPSTGGTVTAPGNGWIRLVGVATAGGQEVSLACQNRASHDTAWGNGYHPVALLKVKKDDVVGVYYSTGGGIANFDFSFDEGAY